MILLLAFTKVPLLVVIGSIEDKAVVRNGKIEIVPMLGVTLTIDHRFMDGGRVKQFADKVN